MRTPFLLSTLAASCLVVASAPALPVSSLFMTATLRQDAKQAFAPAFKADEKLVYKADFKINAGGMEVVLGAKLTQAFKALENDRIQLQIDWSDLALSMGGASGDAPPATPFILKSKKDGTIEEWDGGVQDSDAIRFFLMAHVPWFSKEVTKGEKFTVSFPEVKDKSLPARKSELEFLGAEKVEGVDAFKFKMKYTEPTAPEGFTFETTAWITADHKLIKADTKFSRFFLPAAGMEIEGTATIVLQK